MSIMIGVIDKSRYRVFAVILVLLALVAAPAAKADQDQNPLAVMVARVAPAVVRIFTVRPPAVEEEPKASANLARAADANRTAAIGSGYIIDPSGYIGTNKHVVQGAISVFAVTADGVRYPAKIVGMPSHADMALLKIDAG